VLFLHDRTCPDHFRLARLGDVYPIGSSVGSVNVGGQQWELFDGYNGAMHVYSFVAPQETPDFDTDVKAFFDYLVSNYGFPASEQHLLSK
jgi:xyloglucan-specific endo-beta-1,4-glucanase